MTGLVRRASRWLFGLLLCLALPWAGAQTLDELDLRRQGEQPVLRIRFNAAVRFVQLLPAGPADLYTLRFELVGTDEAVPRQAGEEFRRLPPADGLPELSLRYAPEPGVRVQQITVRLGRPLPLQARQGPNARSIELLLPRPAAAEAPPPAAAAPPRYALLLQQVPLTEKDRVLPVPLEFQNLEVTTREALLDGQPGLEVVISTFASREDAEAALALVQPRFPQARLLELAASGGGAAIRSTAALAEAGTPEVEAEAAPPMAAARQALAAGRADEAVALLERVLRLPPNSQTVAAQELIGQAWERADNPARARLEYALFLKLYPQAEAAGRVAQRLAALGGALAPAAASATETARAAEPPKPWAGSLAQYYYGGKARNNSLVNIATGIDRATLSKTTESAIVTSVDLTGRMTGEGSETRAVVRGSQSKNLLASGHSTSSIGAVYVEHRRGNEGLAVRAGRQSPISGGLLGLFDGVSLTMPVAGVKLDVMGGVPASALVSAPGEKLFAAVVEADQIGERLGGNFYLLDQSTQGITNRRALGSELRYAGEQWSSNLLLDYDSVFAKLNALSLHGSVQLAAQTTLTMLVDMRRAPSLQLTNALISSGAASLRELLDSGRSLDDIRRAALDTSAIARQWLVSVARPLDERWQLAMDLRYSAVGALPKVGDFEATDATGAQYSFSAQLTGTNLYSKRDINNFNLSVMRTPFFDGLQFSYNNLTGAGENNDLSVEPSVRVYTQRNQQQEKLLRIGPGLRLTWRQSARASLLGELLYETSRTDGPTNHDSSNSVFFYVGYRYELF